MKFTDRERILQMFVGAGEFVIRHLVFVDGDGLLDLAQGFAGDVDLRGHRRGIIAATEQRAIKVGGDDGVQMTAAREQRGDVRLEVDTVLRLDGAGFEFAGGDPAARFEHFHVLLQRPHLARRESHVDAAQPSYVVHVAVDVDGGVVGRDRTAAARRRSDFRFFRRGEALVGEHHVGVPVRQLHVLFQLRDLVLDFLLRELHVERRRDLRRQRLADPRVPLERGQVRELFPRRAKTAPFQFVTNLAHEREIGVDLFLIGLLRIEIFFKAGAHDGIVEPARTEHIERLDFRRDTAEHFLLLRFAQAKQTADVADQVGGCAGARRFDRALDGRGLFGCRRVRCFLGAHERCAEQKTEEAQPVTFSEDQLH